MKPEEHFKAVALDNPQCMLCELSGSIELGSTLALDRQLNLLVQNGQRCLVIDMKAVDFINSQGLGIFLAVNKNLNRQGGGLIIIGAKCRVADAIELTGLDQAVSVYADLAHALLHDPLFKNH